MLKFCGRYGILRDSSPTIACLELDSTFMKDNINEMSYPPLQPFTGAIAILNLDIQSLVSPK
jgi:hypothetical protein